MRHFRLVFILAALAAELLLMPAALADKFDEAAAEKADEKSLVSDIDLPGGAFNDILTAKYVSELGLSAEQVNRFKEIRSEFGKVHREFSGVAHTRGREGLEAMRRGLDEARREYPKKLNGVLTLEQRERLFQIYLQRGGFSLLTDAYVAKRLGVTAEQKVQIRKCCRELQERGALVFEFAPSDPAGTKKKMDEIQALHEKSMGEVLTAEQKALFLKLQGEPFKVTGDERR